MGFRRIILLVQWEPFWVLAPSRESNPGQYRGRIIEWKSDGGAKLAGIIGYSFGLLMWITTIPPIRRRYFELFFYIHQLYVLIIGYHSFQVNDEMMQNASHIFPHNNPNTKDGCYYRMILERLTVPRGASVASVGSCDAKEPQGRYLLVWWELMPPPLDSQSRANTVTCLSNMVI
ncbi:hypothetical protein MLD38_009682 [Melastoma candidum]|uniref:Uncharacterized protein n=1 Tax=Melastoma candidum TaxID=119954 RepID=A0ACB9RY14_9MYRT|nr:hypothetical protein MLD38_009682 [Melastoma candidum]